MYAYPNTFITSVILGTCNATPSETLLCYVTQTFECYSTDKVLSLVHVPLAFVSFSSPVLSVQLASLLFSPSPSLFDGTSLSELSPPDTAADDVRGSPSLAVPCSGPSCFG